MRKALTTAMAAITLGGAVAASAVPAQARDHGGGYYGGDYRRDNRQNDAGVAIAAGVLGLALGAALSSGNHTSSYGYAAPNYSNRYGGNRYGGYDYYGRDYQTCESRHWVYDPYVGRNVLVRSRFAC